MSNLNKLFFYLLYIYVINYKGEYRVDLKGIKNCNHSPDNKIHFNYYLSKTSETGIEIKGNATSSIIVDDNLAVSIII